MTSRSRQPRLTAKAIAAAKPEAKENTLLDGTFAHFEVRVHPSGVKSFIVQTRARGRMRKITLGRFPEMGIEKARREAAAVLARLWAARPCPPAEDRGAFVPRLRRPLSRAAIAPLEAVYAGDLRHLPAQPPDATFREGAARRHYTRAGLGLVRRG